MKKLLICLILFFLEGCAAVNTQGNLPSDYQFDAKNHNKGVVALSIACNVHRGLTEMLFEQDSDEDGKPVDENLNYMLLRGNDRILFNCLSNGATLSGGQLKFLSLKPGVYHFNGWDQRPENPEAYLQSTTFHSIYFFVYPNTITYIGRIYLLAGYNNKSRQMLGDAAKEDIPLIKEKLPLISKNEIKIKHAYFGSQLTRD